MAQTSDQQTAFVENLNRHMVCKECQEYPPNLVEEFSSGDTVCGSCGLVLSHHVVDTRSEWRTFSNDDQGNDDPSRVGDAANPLLHGSQLTTSVGFGDGGRTARDLNRAQGKSTIDKQNRSLLQAYKQIGALADVFSMGAQAADAAKHMYKLADDNKLFKGKSSEAVIAGCLFLAARKANVPRTFREITQVTNISKKEIGRITKTLTEFLRKNSRQENSVTAQGMVVPGSGAMSPADSTKPEELIARYSNSLKLSNEITVMCQRLTEKVGQLGVIAGRSPLSVAASCIYFISHLMGKPRTPKQISLAAHVSDGTIKTAYKLLLLQKDALIDEKWIAKGGDPSRLPAS